MTDEESYTFVKDGIKTWSKGLTPHRLNGPARIHPDGQKEWWVEGKLHRTDGPALTHPNGGKEWYQEGKLHRTDGPAIEWAAGGKEWLQDGKLHRLDGPAIEWADGQISWMTEGFRMTEKRYRKSICNLFDELLEEEKISPLTKNAPFSQIESIVYLFQGWIK